MTRAEFRATSIAILRSAVGWQSAIARRLGVADRTVRRWLKEDAIPGWVDEKFAQLTRANDLSPWPRDEWLIGDALGGDGRRREYIMHMQRPRFIARVVACDSEGLTLADEEPADVLSGMVYSADAETLLCEIEWIEPVAAGEHVKWLEAAADALEAMGLSFAGQKSSPSAGDLREAVDD